MGLGPTRERLVDPMTESTTHDPLCDWLQAQCTVETCDGFRVGDPCEHQWCQCDLIVKVRKDEVRKAALIAAMAATVLRGES